ncbi:Argininosuccinate lyase [Candidatus Entotheonellaceae bacterium PAL068K]
MESGQEQHAPAAVCRACGAPQPTANWPGHLATTSGPRGWKQASPVDRYCGVCYTPACDDDELDRLYSRGLDRQSNRLYGTSLVRPTPEVVAFMAGWDVASKGAADQSLVPFDLWVNRAHTHMLVRQSILTQAQGQALLDGLAEIERRYHDGHFVVHPAQEDVHTHIETCLTNDLGIEAALAIHTARSRNDQVVTDMRLWMRARVLNLAGLCLELLQNLVEVARLHLDSVMAGYTHHQHATISTFGHHLAAYAEAMRRVVQRLHAWYELFNYSPLGCVTGLSTTFPIDRHFTADLLGCYGPEPNSLDPMASRWEPEAELAQIVSVLLTHLSSMAQTFILLSTQEFGLLKLHPRFCSGSSIMPQKVNPDALEVIKGKTADVTNRLSGLLSLGRASLTGYNRDQQWSKYLIMEVCLEGLPVVSIMSRIVAHSCRPRYTNPWLQCDVGIDTTRLRRMAKTGFASVTELMEQLVSQTGIEFRRWKRVMERAVALSLHQGEYDCVTHAALCQALRQEDLEVEIDAATVDRLQNPVTILAAKQVVGGPGRHALETELVWLEDFVRSQRHAWQTRSNTLQTKYHQCYQLG